ncbi:tripartite tricarboxylate transporter permease [Thalassobacter stenotrophicus]|uniref:Tripartite tricarboxylate transporter TctA family protein n=2 Tax=Thalassobacter stenotrophicus TaxID=266809 RepID=A0A0N7LT96_9RHOB|nr:tripartite tricarboxylate transporter permease [Thalassobacter stenotrophicus]PVZ47339.1 tricarboxylate transporter [Thalassobacter stenotrophicus]CUH60082.1 Tripartite tricarboxylate transporter TctA family protein [Thalassobacter stenotrophicus]SHJ20632.1 putative tricarboxylic transport membrane protein [Thalassobacter stenotrophicus DSM 16310]
MELLGYLGEGFATSLMPINILIVMIGVTAGLFIGAMPGLGSVNGVAIVLPITFIVPPSSAIILLCAIYYGAMYGGAISSILLGIPGASTAVATTFDGRPMAQQGKAGLALIAAAAASFVGGTISVVLFTLFAVPLADVALAFGPAEEFALVLLAFTTFVGLGGDDVLKTIIMICLGLVLSAVGLDLISGDPRLIFFDQPGFYSGISFLVLAIGIYGVGEILYTIETQKSAPQVTPAKITFRELWYGLKEINKLWKTMSFGSFLGFFVGMLPAAGATPAALMSYGIAKLLSKKPETFGKGAIEGVAAPETANNAASTGSLLPMLTLGIPGSPTTALLLGGMVMWGLVPGPMLFIEQPDFVWGLISSLYTANLFAVLVNLALIPLFVWALRMPFTVLCSLVFVLCLVGGFAPSQKLHDVWLIVGFGVVGYVLRKADYPMAPLVLALVLGPLMERSFRQTLIAEQGNMMAFVERPISGTFMAIAALFFVLPMLKHVKRLLRRDLSPAE